jgi:VWFA-related protein
MRFRKTIFALLTLTALLAFSPARVPAQTGVDSNLPGAGFGPQDTSVPTLHVTTRETVIDVLVTDNKGQTVRGLTHADFTVEEDGKPQPIRSFREYDKSTPPAPPLKLPPNTYTNARSLPANGPVQIFLFDVMGSPPPCMVGAKPYIADYLRTMPAGTQVVLFALSPSKGLILLNDFTSDGPAAAAALLNSLDAEWFRNPVVAKPIAIAGMNQIAAYIAGIHGRKNLIWVVPGMPLMITRDGGYAQRSAMAPDMTYIHDLMDLYDRFTQEQIAIYPLNPCGIHDLNGDDQEVADATGGALENTNDYKGEAARFVESTSHMYTLSYVPTRPDEDGHFHPIKITVDRPGLHLVYRNGYNDEQPHPPDPALIHDLIQGPMRLGALPSTQILFDLKVESGSVSSSKSSASPIPSAAIPHTKGTPYNVIYIIDPKRIALPQTPDGVRTASIELDLGAYDLYGQRVATRSQTFKITITPAQYNGFFRTPLKFSLPIDLPRGQLKLRAGLFDTVANKAGTLEIPLKVEKGPAIKKPDAAKDAPGGTSQP